MSSEAPVAFREEFVAHRARVEAELEGLGRRMDHVSEAKRRHATEILALVGTVRGIETRTEARLGALETKLEEIEAAGLAQHEVVTARIASLERKLGILNAVLAALYALLTLVR